MEYWDTGVCAVCKIGAIRIYIKEAIKLSSTDKQDPQWKDDYNELEQAGERSVFLCGYTTPQLNPLGDFTDFDPTSNEYTCHIDEYYFQTYQYSANPIYRRIVYTAENLVFEPKIVFYNQTTFI